MPMHSQDSPGRALARLTFRLPAPEMPFIRRIWPGPLAGSAALALLLRSALGASATWSGAVDANWASPGNWSATPLPGTGDIATFSTATGGNSIVSLGAGVTVRGVYFTNAPAFTIGSGAPGSQTLTLNHTGEIWNQFGNTGPQTVNAAIVLGTNANASTYTLYNYDSVRDLTLTGPITGGTGGTAGAKVLRVAGNTGVAGNVIVNGNIGGGGGTIAVTKDLSGSLTLTGTNTFTGALTITSGTVIVPVINNSGAAGPLGNSTGAVVMSNTVTKPRLRYTGPTASSNKRISIGTSGASLEVEQAAAELTMTGVLDGTGALSKDGPGTLILTGANTHTGNFVNSGMLRLSGTGTLGAAAGALFTAGTVMLNGRSATVSDLDSTASGLIYNGSNTACTLTDNSIQSGTMQGRLMDTAGGSTGSLSLVKSGAGSLVLLGDNSYTGTTTVSGGYLSCAHLNALGSSSTGTTVSSGGTVRIFADSAEPVTISGVGSAATEDGAIVGFGGIQYQGLITLAAAARVSVFPSGGDTEGPLFLVANPGTITGNFALTLSGSGSGEMNSVIGTASLVKDGTGLWKLMRANTYAGVTTVSGGILRILHGGALGTTAGNTTIIAGATLQIAGDITTSAEPLTIRGTGDAGASGALENKSGDNTYAGLVTLGADSTISCTSGSLTLSHTGNITGAGFDLTLSGAGDGLINSVIGTGAGLLNKTGTGKWRLAGLNTFTGRTTVNEGVLEITTLKNVSGGASSLGAPTTVANGTINLGAAATAGGLRFTGAADAASNRVINLAGTTGGAILDSSSATNTKLVLSGAMTATGLGDKTLQLTGTSTGANEISGAIVNSTGFRTSVSKTGPGSWILSGVNTYAGNTAISEGALTLTRAGLADSSDVSITSGGALTLNFAGTDTIARLYINGVQQSAGTWGSNTSAATFKSPYLFGSGILNVTSGPPPGSFPVWISGFGLSGPDTAFDADPDGDGITNGMEWVFNSSPAESSFPSPLTVAGDAGNTTITFPRVDATETSGTLVLSRSTDLLTWVDLPIGPVSFVDAGSGISVSVAENGAAADTVQVTVNRQNARLYLRLRVYPSVP